MPKTDNTRKTVFFHDLLIGLLRDLMFVVFVFGLATGTSAIACLMYGIPLIFSLIGGFIVLGVWMFMRTAQPFDWF